MRAIKSVLVVAGGFKRTMPQCVQVGLGFRVLVGAYAEVLLDYLSEAGEGFVKFRVFLTV